MRSNAVSLEPPLGGFQKDSCWMGVRQSSGATEQEIQSCCPMDPPYSCKAREGSHDHSELRLRAPVPGTPEFLLDGQGVRLEAALESPKNTELCFILWGYNQPDYNLWSCKIFVHDISGSRLEHAREALVGLQPIEPALRLCNTAEPFDGRHSCRRATVSQRGDPFLTSLGAAIRRPRACPMSQ
jgi:hypothetical protein